MHISIVLYKLFVSVPFTELRKFPCLYSFAVVIVYQQIRGNVVVRFLILYCHISSFGCVTLSIGELHEHT